jgi:hypothetical protein
MSNKKKHKILDILNNFYQEKSHEALNYTNLGKSMSIEQLHDKTKFSISDLKILCKSLENATLICPIYNTNEPLVRRYYVNDLGQIALKEEYFLNLLWYKDYRIVIPALISSVISLFGILISMYLSTNNTVLQEKVSKLEQKIHILQVKIDSIEKSGKK